MSDRGSMLRPRYSPPVPGENRAIRRKREARAVAAMTPEQRRAYKAARVETSVSYALGATGAPLDVAGAEARCRELAAAAKAEQEAREAAAKAERPPALLLWMILWAGAALRRK